MTLPVMATFSGIVRPAGALALFLARFDTASRPFFLVFFKRLKPYKATKNIIF